MPEFYLEYLDQKNQWKRLEDHVGCAIVVTERKQAELIFLACHYPDTEIRFIPVLD